MDILIALIIGMILLLIVLVALLFIIVFRPRHPISSSRVKEDLRKIKAKISEAEDD